MSDTGTIRPALTPEARVPADVRFERHVERVTETGCWLWIGNTDRKGYGRFFDLARRHGVLAHRWAYVRFCGAIPAGLTLDHLCRTPCCVNPWHLEPVSNRENSLRGATVAAKNAGKATCPDGHPYTTIVERGKTRRRCMTCQRAAVRKAMRKARARHV